MKAVAVGPGFGRTDGARLLARELLGVGRPLLLDADGLHALGGHLELLAERTQPTVLTPHEGELGRLLAAPRGGRGPASASPAPRRSAPAATVVLKGEATIVADRRDGLTWSRPATPASPLRHGRRAHRRHRRPAGQRSAGHRGGLFRAYLHGLAADLVAEEATGTDCMVASDLFQSLPAAVERLKAGPQEENHEHH